MKIFAAILYIVATGFLLYGVVTLVDSTGKWVSADYALMAMTIAVLAGICTGFSVKATNNGESS